MSEDIREKGVILKKMPYADADEIITVLFERSGVKKLFVKGSRRSQKRFLGRIDHFEELSFQYTRKAQGLSLLKTIDDLPGVFKNQALQNIFNFAFLSYFAELIREFFWEEMRADHVYDLWQKLAEDVRQGPLELKRAIYYQLKLLNLSGYTISQNPEMERTALAVLNSERVSRVHIQTLLRYPESILERSLKSLDFLMGVLPEN